MFENIFEIYDVTFEVYIEDKLVKKQMLQAPKEMIMINFMQMTEEIKKDNRPMKIKIIRPDIIWDSFENKQKVLNNEVSASNHAMIVWEENKQEA